MLPVVYSGRGILEQGSPTDGSSSILVIPSYYFQQESMKIM